MNKITAIVLTKNEEKNLDACLTSVNFCDEVIVVDSYSTDDTAQIAEAHRAKIFKRHLNNDFAGQRNFGIKQATHEWVLFVDADERVSKELQKEIEKTVKEKITFQSYCIRRRDWWWGKELKYGEVQRVRNRGLIRLIKKGSGHWEGAVHEEFKTQSASGTLSAFLDHYPHPTLKAFLHDINEYSSIRAKELLAKGMRASLWSILAFPLAKFLLVYFVYLGLLDGPAGFSYAFLMSFHSFLVRAKMYQLTKQGT